MKRRIHWTALLALPVLLLASACQKPGRSGPATNPSGGNPKIQRLKAKAEELAKTDCTVKLNPSAKITGKVAVVTRDAGGFFSLGNYATTDGEYNLGDLNNYGLTKDDLAASPDEIDTLVVIWCDKGKKVGEYTTDDYRTIDAFTQECKVTVANYKTRTVFAQKTIISAELDKNTRISKSTTERVAYYPTAEIGKYVRGLKP